MSAAQWLMGMKLRLGLARRPGAARTCALRNAAGKPCEKPLDEQLTHIATCNTGPVRSRPHLARTNAQIDVERYIPELYTKDHEAILDLCVTWPGRAERFLLDVTVRAPGAKKHARADGKSAARQAGVGSKRLRYGTTVDAIAITHFGRMADESREALARLAAASRIWAPGRLGARPGVSASHLQTVAEAAVLRAIADAYLLALGATSAAAVGWKRGPKAGPVAHRAHAKASPQPQSQPPPQAVPEPQQQPPPEQPAAAELPLADAPAELPLAEAPATADLLAHVDSDEAEVDLAAE